MDALKDIQDTSAKTVTLTLSIYRKHIDIVTKIVTEKNEIKNLERSVRRSINFSNFQHLFKNYLANFNQTWHKLSLGKGNSKL